MNEIEESVVRATCNIVQDAYSQLGLGQGASLDERAAIAERGVETLLSQVERVRKALSTSAHAQSGS